MQDWNLVPDIQKTYCEVAKFAQDFGAERVVLFGSRARGNNLPKSDIDLAVQGCSHFFELEDALKNNLWTLLDVDVVNLDADISDELRCEIDRDGVVLYEKV